MSAKPFTIKERRWRCKCDRTACGHEWVTLTDQLPLVCPKCKALTWNGSMAGKLGGRPKKVEEKK